MNEVITSQEYEASARREIKAAWDRSITSTDIGQTAGAVVTALCAVANATLSVRAAIEELHAEAAGVVEELRP